MRVKSYENVFRQNLQIINLSDAVGDIKSGKYKDEMDAYHAEDSTNVRKALKQNLTLIEPCVDPIKTPLSTNGLVHFDVDLKDNEHLDFVKFKYVISQFSETTFAFHSVNGGLKFAIQTDLLVTCDKRGEYLYKHAYDQCSEWLSQYFDVYPDHAVRTPKCTMFISHDPSAYFNESAQPFQVLDAAIADFEKSKSISIPKDQVEDVYIIDLFGEMPKNAKYSERLIANYMLLEYLPLDTAIAVAVSHWDKPKSEIVSQLESQSKNKQFASIYKVEQLVKKHGGVLPKKVFHKSFKQSEKAQNSSHKFGEMLSVDEAQKQLKSQINEVFENGKTVCVRSSAGAGKTEITLTEIVKKAKDKKVLYITPTHFLGREVAQRYQNIAANSGQLDPFNYPNQIYGRSNVDHNGHYLCEAIEIREKYAQAKLSIPSFECERCMYEQQCSYTQQFNETSNFRIQTNAQLYISPSKYENGFSVKKGRVELNRGNWNPDIIVIDEDFVKFDEFSITKNTNCSFISKIMLELEAAHLRNKLSKENLLKFLEDLIERNKTQVIQSYSSSQSLNIDSSDAYITSQKAFSKDEKLALKFFYKALTAKEKAMSGLWLRIDKGTLSLNGSIRKCIKDRFNNTPTLILDATADEAVLKQIMPCVEIANLNVKPNPQVQLFQCQNASFSKEFLKKDLYLEALISQLNGLIDKHKPRKVGLISYKSLADKTDFEHYLRKQLHHDNIVAKHFGDIKGTNVFDDVDLFFLVGKHDIGVQHVVSKSEAIFGTNLAQHSSRVPVPIRMSDGTTKALNNRLFADERVQATYNHFCRAETLQAAARTRPIHGQAKIGYIFNNEGLGEAISMAGFFDFNYSETPLPIRKLEAQGFVRTTPQEMKNLGYTDNACKKQNRLNIISNFLEIGCQLAMVEFKDSHYKVKTHEYLVMDQSLFEKFCADNNYTIM